VDNSYYFPLIIILCLLSITEFSTTNITATKMQIFPEMIERSKMVYHNVKTSSSYKNLDAFRRASLNKKVKDIARYIDELRWVKSKSEVKLMRESASIVSQVFDKSFIICHTVTRPHDL
jgi:Xaa-Pro aminopeptidase